MSGTCISKTLMGIAGEAADGVFATTNIKDPLNPAFADDPAMEEYLATLEEYGADDVDPENGIVAYGYTQAALLVEILEQPRHARPCGADEHDVRPRQGVTGGLLLDGVEVNTSPDDRFLAEDVQMIQYDAGQQVLHQRRRGPRLRGHRPPSITPEDLINS